MTTAKRQTLADFMYYSLCAGPDEGRPVRLLAAAAQPGAGRLRAARQAEGGRPGGRPHRPRRRPSATTRRSTASNLSREQAGRDRAAAGGLRQGRARARAAPTPARTSRRRTTGRPRRTSAVETPRYGDRRGDPGAGSPSRARLTAAHRQSTRRPERSSPRSAATTGTQAADYAAPTELASSRPADTATFGWLAAAAARRPGAAARAAWPPRCRRRSRTGPT